MSIQIPVISASGAKSVVTVADPVVGTPPAVTGPSPAYWSNFANGHTTADTWFPIGVWNCYAAWDFGLTGGYANHGKAVADAGVNLLLGSYSWLDDATYGPAHLSAAKAAGLTTICDGPNMTYLNAHPGDAAIIDGWLLGDEFDMSHNSKNDADGANAVYALYQAAKGADPTRPKHINFGKCYGTWVEGTMAGGDRFQLGHVNGYDTGTETGDLQLYLKATDSVSVDTYYWTDMFGTVHGAWFYGAFIDSTRHFQTNRAEPIWGFVENSRIAPNTPTGITPFQMEAAIWSMVVHGARGIMYFIHDFGPTNPTGQVGIWSSTYYDRAAGDAIIAKMKVVNARLKGLAQVLNSPELGTIDATTGREVATSLLGVTSTSAIPVDTMVRQFGGKTYVFAQASGDGTHLASGNTTGTFTWKAGGNGPVVVRDENRNVTMTNGVFTDTFSPYQMHIYVF